MKHSRSISGRAARREKTPALHADGELASALRSTERRAEKITMIERVCSSCFDDVDLRTWIRGQGGRRGCDACKKYDSPTCTLAELCNHMHNCLSRYWGKAANQLPFETAEGGYQGVTWDTYDILADEVQLGLPRAGGDDLFFSLCEGVSTETWCEYDWLSLDEDIALRDSWEKLCETIKHKRRFFFAFDDKGDRDTFAPTTLLKFIAEVSFEMGLVRDLPQGTRLKRARVDLPRRHPYNARDFGPPPAEKSLQSNRMNPPGVPMLYLASTSRGALREVRASSGFVGSWTALRPLRVLDLRQIPPVPGIFSDAGRRERLTLIFLHHFSNSIMKPVERDDRVHIDYLPSQVVTEFFRDYSFGEDCLDGIAYQSTVNRRSWNLVLFSDLADLGLSETERSRPQSLKFTGAVRTYL